MNKPLTANEVESDITVLRNANAREKQRNRSGQRAARRRCASKAHSPGEP
jgi:hypothetical protein